MRDDDGGGREREREGEASSSPVRWKERKERTEQSSGGDLRPFCAGCKQLLQPPAHHSTVFDGIRHATYVLGLLTELYLTCEERTSSSHARVLCLFFFPKKISFSPFAAYVCASARTASEAARSVYSVSSAAVGLAHLICLMK